MIRSSRTYGHIKPPRTVRGIRESLIRASASVSESPSPLTRITASSLKERYPTSRYLFPDTKMTSQPTNPLPASFLSNNEAWRPSWHNPATMAQIRRSGNTPFTPTMISTSLPCFCSVPFLFASLMNHSKSHAWTRAATPCNFSARTRKQGTRCCLRRFGILAAGSRQTQ